MSRRLRLHPSRESGKPLDFQGFGIALWLGCSTGADSGGMSDQVTEDPGVAPEMDGLIEEISPLRAQEAQLEERGAQLDELAHQDTLIDMPNRRGFMRALERFIDRAKRYGEPSAMLFVDLDGLKSINDSFGHKAGDEALIQ